METTKTDKFKKINQTMVKFCRAGKLSVFNANHLRVKQNDTVVVETDKGLGIGTVAKEPVLAEVKVTERIPKIVRIATEDDFKQISRNRQKEKNSFDICQKKIIEMNLPMKLIRVEFTLGGGKAAFYFSAEGRVDFRELVKSLVQELHTKVEMCQVGVRDEAKMTGGLGICGKEFCCSGFLRDFAPVSIKMAKAQNLALNPQKVSGGCGRLLCCLAYEYDTYLKLGEKMPKLGKKVNTPKGPGKVKFVDMFKDRIQIELDEGGEEIFAADEITQGGNREKE